MKYCKDCKYFQRRNEKGNVHPLPLCNRERVISLVTGTYVSVVRFCVEERKDSLGYTRCGTKAKYFRPKKKWCMW